MIIRDKGIGFSQYPVNIKAEVLNKMAITWQSESGNTFVIRVSDRVDYQDIIRFLDKSGMTPKRQTVISILVLCAKNLQLELWGDTAMLVADKLKERLSQQRVSNLAFVCQADYIYGLCRQLGMRVESSSIRVDTFRTEIGARYWLRVARFPAEECVNAK